MTIGAVVFDLFHTLVDPEPHYPAGYDKRGSIASVAGVERAGLVAFWEETYVQRETTTIDLVDLIDRHCTAMGVPLATDARDAIDEILGVGVDHAIREPDPEIVELLDRVRRGAAVGILSNCHEREVRHWHESPLAVRCDVFGRSSRIGAMKPDPSAFEWILDRLGVPAASSAYVGNGGSDELVGAREVGFATVVHCNVYDRRQGMIEPAEQRRRAAQADVSVDSIDEMIAVVESIAVDN